MNLDILQKIFTAHSLPEPRSFHKIEVGFTNSVYKIDGEYILKVCNDINNEKPFSLEARLYDFFKNKLPVPQLLVFDKSKSHIPNYYLIYPAISGENLYDIWHTYTDETRQEIIKQLCAMLRHISDTAIDSLSEFLEPVSSWRSVILGRIRKYADICAKAGTLTSPQMQNIDTFCSKYAECLNEQRLALVYWDAHFDNVLVKDSKIVGLLDFERTEIASIDFALDTVKRMVDFPKKYMSAHAEQFAKDKDYAKLLDWYREFYPELFDFEQLDRRLDFYSLAHDLEDLENWPNVKALTDNINKTLGL